MKFKVFKFLVFGVVINLFQACIYFSLIWLNFGSILSLSIIYLIGVICSIFLNKNYTFNFKKPSPKVWIFFGIIHVICFVLSQVINETSLFILQKYDYKYLISYILSVGTVATINFLSMHAVIKRLQFIKQKVGD